MLPPYYPYYRRRYYAKPLIVWTLLTVCLVCWLTSFFLSVGYPVYGETNDTPLWNFICAHLPGKIATYLIGLALMIGGASLLNKTNYELTLIPRSARLTFLLYILFISTNPDFFPFKSISLSVFYLIGAMYQLFTSYHDPESREKAYSAALLIGIGSLLWAHLLWFLPLFWLGMYRFRSLTPHTFAASLLGVLTVYWLLFGWCVWQRDFTFFTSLIAALSDIHFLTADGIDFRDWVGFFPIAILAFAASLRILLGNEGISFRSRQFLGFLVLMFVWAFGLSFLYEETPEEFIETACIPASLLITHLFSVSKGKFMFYLFIVANFALLFIFCNRLWNFL